MFGTDVNMPWHDMTFEFAAQTVVSKVSFDLLQTFNVPLPCDEWELLILLWDIGRDYFATAKLVNLGSERRV
jgi:hypothetical protein